MFEKLHVDFRTKSRMGCVMANDDKIDPSKVRAGLFALVTARLEDAHDIAVKGQGVHLNDQNVKDLIVDLHSVLEEVKIQIDTLDLMYDP